MSKSHNNQGVSVNTDDALRGSSPSSNLWINRRTIFKFRDNIVFASLKLLKNPIVHLMQILQNYILASFELNMHNALFIKLDAGGIGFKFSSEHEKSRCD